MSKDMHSGCEMCGIVEPTAYTEGKGYLCPACLAGEDNFPPMQNTPTDAQRAEAQRIIEFSKKWQVKNNE